MRKLARTTVVTGFTIAGMAVVGAAVAAPGWNATQGAGQSKSQGKAGKAVEVISSAPVSAQIYPGAKGDLLLTITNTNPYAVKVTGFAVNAPTGITSDGGAGCTGTATGITSNLSANQTTLPTAFNLPANTGSTTVTLVDGIKMDNTSDSSCQSKDGAPTVGATFTVPVSVLAVSNAAADTFAGTSTTVGQ